MEKEQKAASPETAPIYTGKEDPPMPYELMIKYAARFASPLKKNEMGKDAVLDEIRQVTFGKPLVPVKEVYELCRRYDPNFKPVASSADRSKRQEMSKQAQDGILDLVSWRIDPSFNPGSVDPDAVRRHHFVLLRECDTPEKMEEMKGLLYGGDKKALGQYYFDRFLEKKQELLDLLDMEDEELLNNYFQNAHDIELIDELHKIKEECEFTPEQQELIDELYDKQTEFALLAGRVDLIASPYYAEYPFERLSMSAEQSMMFKMELDSIAARHGERMNSNNGTPDLCHPAAALAHSYNGLQAFSLGVLEEQIQHAVKPYGGTPQNIQMATNFGALGDNTKITDSLWENGLVFVNIPGKTSVALYNASTNPRVCKPKVATPEIVHEHMVRTANAGADLINDANPFLLATFTGSKQFNDMAKQYKEAAQAIKDLKQGLSSDEIRARMNAILKLSEKCDAYLQYKREQGLEIDPETDLPIGRTANEATRIAAAQKASEIAEGLMFQFQYYLDPAYASATMDETQKAKEAKKQAEIDAANRRRAEQSLNNQPVAANYSEEELCKTPAQEMFTWGEIYKNMPACPKSDIGDVLDRQRQNMYTISGMLAMTASRNEPYSPAGANNTKENMVRLVLFNYALRERAAAQPQEDGTFIAGPVEHLLDNRQIISRIANSEAFNNMIGKITPARVEAFLKNHEAKSPQFNAVILEALAPAKANAPENQPQQMQKEAPQASPQVKAGP